ALGHLARRTGRFLPRVSPLRAVVRLSRLHAHARRPLRRQGGGRSAADQRPPLHELSRFIHRTDGGDEGLLVMAAGPPAVSELLTIRNILRHWLLCSCINANDANAG